MSSLFGKSALKPASPAMRKEVRSVSQPSRPHGNGATAQSRSTSSTQLSRPKPQGPPLDRYKLTPSFRTKARDHTTNLRKAQKRKSASPAMHMSSASEGDSDIPEARPQQKRARTTDGQKGPTRQIRDVGGRIEDGSPPRPIIHSIDLTIGEYAKDYLPMFEEDEHAEVALQYPSTGQASQLERFRLVRPIKDDHDPPSDLVETIKTILRFYLPSDRGAPLLDESSGIPFLLSRAIKHKDLAAISSCVTTFNSTLVGLLDSNTVSAHLDTLPAPPRDLIQRILTQVYARTVSPSITTLSAYAAASDNVYGELQYPFCSTIFRETGLTPSSTFLDLGSGVGNVVLQAALEVGCESWGIEMMPKACTLASAQATEFSARAALWGLHVGGVHLLEGDFFSDPRLDAVLRTADVVLVNNQAFQPETNSALVSKFLEMKDGARLVSLKNFASGYVLRQNTQDNPVAVWDVREREFWHDWVSWTHRGGNWYVARKDPGRIERVLGRGRKGR